MRFIEERRSAPHSEFTPPMLHLRMQMFVEPDAAIANIAKTLLVIAILFIYSATRLGAQDIHLSHIHASPTYINPAMTGLFNGDMRFIGNYRSQWQSFTNGFQTFLGSADMKLNQGFGLQDDVGAGIQVTSDKAGDLNYSTTSANFTLSYLKALNGIGDHFISVGISNGFVQNRLDLSQIRIFDQDPLLQNPDFMSRNSYYDLNLGAAWFVPLRRQDFAYLGGSIYHLNQAFVSFNRNRDVPQPGTSLIPRYILHGGASVRLNQYVTLKPSFLFFDQDPHREFNMGTFLKITRETRTYLRPEYAFYAGLWYRWSIKDGELNRDALIASLRYDFRRTVFSFSFDLNISDLQKASNGVGGPELSVMHFLDFIRPQRKRVKVKCPEV
ncbi:MAG: PorP/SprF family type IX secretion system membrane protein [Saprospiraceae bacterium]|nr:PorP/SprF family type IX secretion system membrane protein [Saprospiraceae bacterium]